MSRQEAAQALHHDEDEGFVAQCTPLSYRALRTTGSPTDASCFEGFKGAIIDTLMQFAAPKFKVYVH